MEGRLTLQSASLTRASQDHTVSPSSLLRCQQCPCCEDMVTPYIGFQQCSGVTESHQDSLLPTRKSQPLPYLPGKCWDWEISAVLPSPFAGIQILSFCLYKKCSRLNLFIFIHDDLSPPVLIPSTRTPLANDNPEAGLESAVNLWFLGLREGRHIYVKHSAKQIG